MPNLRTKFLIVPCYDGCTSHPRGFSTLLIIAFVALAAVALFVLTDCSNGGAPVAQRSLSATTSPVAVSHGFSVPEKVTIEGCSGPQEDPVISPDGKYLYFHRVPTDTGSQLYVLTRQ